MELPERPSLPPVVRGSDNGGLKEKLTDLIAQATAKYAVKDYNSAADLYSRATELQDEINGEMSTENAELLYAYGRCLYHVAIKNSDVLGAKVADVQRDDGKKEAGPEKVPKASSSKESQENSAAHNTSSKVVGKKAGAASYAPNSEKKLLFQFTGDENFVDSDEEGEDEDAVPEAEGEADQDEDDFANAFEVLDMARVLLQRRLKEVQKNEGSLPANKQSEVLRQLKERLSDTHDLQAEISLEGERFLAAVVDLKAAIQLKEEIYPPESQLLAEGHYKLSLALEFSSITQPKDSNGEILESGEIQVDKAMREEAAQEMEAAISSCKLRIKKEQAALKSKVELEDSSSKHIDIQEKIAEVQELVKDMEQRLVELHQPPVSVAGPSGINVANDINNPAGLLGAMLGQSSEAQQANLAKAMESANDLSMLVKKKKPANGSSMATTPTESNSSRGKRKLETNEGSGSERGKRPLLDEDA
ncbi:MAG: hypothetical protein MMC33_002358 [Icmadophila ericetorum]|nr:hypothetical protein [Icmadophila ericetorum]